MRISYSLLRQMAAEGDVNARFVLEKWDHELEHQAVHGKKIECNVSESGEVSLFVHRNKTTLPHTPAAIVQQNVREQKPTLREMKSSVPPSPATEPTLPGVGQRTLRPELRKETWQWLAVQRPDLNIIPPELPIPDKAKTPYPTQYSGVCSEDD